MNGTNENTIPQLYCPSCGEDRLVMAGQVWSGQHNKRQQYLCNACGIRTIVPLDEDGQEVRVRIVLPFDLTHKETGSVLPT